LDIINTEEGIMMVFGDEIEVNMRHAGVCDENESLVYETLTLEETPTFIVTGR